MLSVKRVIIVQQKKKNEALFNLILYGYCPNLNI